MFHNVYLKHLLLLATIVVPPMNHSRQAALLPSVLFQFNKNPGMMFSLILHVAFISTYDNTFSNRLLIVMLNAISPAA